MVTGGLGFVGKAIVRMLQDCQIRVVSLDKAFLVNAVNDDLFQYYQGDINDVSRLIEIMIRENVDSLIHTAAISHPVVSRNIPYQTVVTNALGTTAVFEAARLSKVRRVVNFSSECVYGDNQEFETVVETISLHPTTPYGVTKVFTEHLANVYTSLYQMEIPSLRPGWIYGPGQFMQCYLKTMIRNAIRHVATRESQGSDYRFHYVYVDDVARAAVLALTVPNIGSNVFNITAGRQFRFPEVVAEVKKIFPDADIEIGPGTIAILDQNAKFSIEKARTLLGYEPQYDLRTGLKIYADWLKDHEF